MDAMLGVVAAELSSSADEGPQCTKNLSQDRVLTHVRVFPAAHKSPAVVMTDYDPKGREEDYSPARLPGPAVVLWRWLPAAAQLRAVVLAAMPACKEAKHMFRALCGDRNTPLSLQG